MTLKQAWARWGWPVVAVLPSLVAMAPMWSSQAIYSFRDAVSLWWPYQVWFRREVYSGVFPMWDPSGAFGQSAVVDPSRLLFFPPAILARLIPNDALAHNLFLAAPAPVLALGAYLMLRARVSKEAAAVGAALLSLSHPFVSTLNMTNIAWSLALGPWLVVALTRLASRPSWLRLGLAATAVALMVLAAQPVTAIGMMIVALVFALFDAGDEGTSFRSRVTWVSTASVSGLLLAAIQILPIFAVLGASQRSDAANLDYLTWSLHPFRLVEAIVSMPFGNGAMSAFQFAPWMTTLNTGREPFLLSVYVGIATLALATLGAISGHRRSVVLWLALAGVGLVLAFGQHAGLLPAILELVPALRMFRMPEKHILVTTLALYALAAHGWDALRARRITAGGFWSVVGVVMGCILALVAAYGTAPELARLIGVAEPEVAVAMLRRALAFGLVPVATASALAIATLAATRAGHSRMLLLQVLLAGVAAIDLIFTGTGLCPQTPVHDLAAPTWVQKAVASRARSFVGSRLEDYPEPDPDAFPPTFNLPNRNYSTGNAIIASLTATNPALFDLRDSFTVDTTNMWPREYHAARDRFHHASSIERATFLSRTGVRVQLLDHAPPGPYGPPEHLEWAAKIAVYHSSDPVERAVLVPDQAVEPNPMSAADALFRPEFDFRRVALVDREAPPAGTPGPGGGPEIRVLSETANTITIEATCDVESTLVVLDSYAPGWRAEVDGVEAPVARADGLFRGVRLAPGRHTVAMSYVAPGLRTGAAISAAMALALIARVWLERRRSR